MPASSTMTVVPAASRYSSSGSRSVRLHSWSSLATVSVFTPVSRSSTWALLAVGATPNTARSQLLTSSTARSNVVVLPVPAGPTTTTRRSDPATAAAASACRTSRPARATVDDGAGSSAWACIAQASTCSSSARIASLVKCGATGSTHTERPSDDRRVEPVSGGSRSTQRSITRSAARSRAAARSCSAASMPATSRSGPQPSPPASAAHRDRRLETPWPLLCARVSPDASRQSAARSRRIGSRPSRSRNSSTLGDPCARRRRRCANRVRTPRPRESPDHLADLPARHQGHAVRRRREGGEPDLREHDSVTSPFGGPIPDEIVLTRVEATVVLFALDEGIDAVNDVALRSRLEGAAPIIVEKLLPDLPDL